MYGEHAAYFNPAEVNDFRTRLAQISDYWDFSLSSVSKDPRYFYDATHFRNPVGDMALARIFNDDRIYVPDDFGVLVTADNVSRPWGGIDYTKSSYTAQVPILMYHHLDEDASSTVIWPARFESHLRALKDAGYHTISLRSWKTTFKKGASLPEKPVSSPLTMAT